MSDDPMVAVLREHEDTDAWGYRTTCSCGGWTSKPMFTTSWRLVAHAAHLADVLRAAGYIHRDEVGGGECEHDWSQRGDKADPWVQCWLCGEIRNGWPANHLQDAVNSTLQRAQDAQNGDLTALQPRNDLRHTRDDGEGA